MASESASTTMEKKINSLISEYLKEMKEQFASKVGDGAQVEELYNYIQEYPTLQLSESDYSKKKRARTKVLDDQQCIAKRANGEQCSRRKKKDCDFCGTHTKGCPHGIVEKSNTDQVKSEDGEAVVKKQIQVWLEDFNGIMYWINDYGSIYDTSDVINNVENPRVIGKYEKSMEDEREVYRLIGGIH